MDFGDEFGRLALVDRHRFRFHGEGRFHARPFGRRPVRTLFPEKTNRLSSRKFFTFSRFPSTAVARIHNIRPHEYVASLGISANQHPRKKKIINHDGTRNHNLLIRNQTPYPLSHKLSLWKHAAENVLVQVKRLITITSLISDIFTWFSRWKNDFLNRDIPDRKIHESFKLRLKFHCVEPQWTSDFWIRPARAIFQLLPITLVLLYHRLLSGNTDHTGREEPIGRPPYLGRPCSRAKIISTVSMPAGSWLSVMTDFLPTIQSDG